MNNNIIIGSQIKLNGLNEDGKPLVNIDVNYGPYNTMSEALSKLSDRIRNTALTFCVIENNEPQEYWFLPDGSVKKKNAGDVEVPFNNYFSDKEDYYNIKHKNGNTFIKSREDGATDICRINGKRVLTIKDDSIIIYSSSNSNQSLLLLDDDSIVIRKANDANIIRGNNEKTAIYNPSGEEAIRIEDTKFAIQHESIEPMTINYSTGEFILKSPVTNYPILKFQPISDESGDRYSVKLCDGNLNSILDYNSFRYSVRLLYDKNSILEGDSDRCRFGSPDIEDTTIIADSVIKLGFSDINTDLDYNKQYIILNDGDNEIAIKSNYLTRITVGGVSLLLDSNKLQKLINLLN